MFDFYRSRLKASASNKRKSRNPSRKSIKSARVTGELFNQPTPYDINSIQWFICAYRPVASHAASLYSCIGQLKHLNKVYQFSLPWFLNLFTNVRKESKYFLLSNDGLNISLFITVDCGESDFPFDQRKDRLRQREFHTHASPFYLSGFVQRRSAVIHGFIGFCCSSIQGTYLNPVFF